MALPPIPPTVTYTARMKYPMRLRKRWISDIRVGDILHFKPSGFKGKIGHIAPITVEAYPAGVLALQTYTSREDEYYIPFKVTEQVYISRKWDC